MREWKELGLQRVLLGETKAERPWEGKEYPGIQKRAESQRGREEGDDNPAGAALEDDSDGSRGQSG